MKRLFAAIELLLRFAWQVVVSGVTTARIIIAPRLGAHPVVARFHYAGLDERGAAILGCLITLTPGTTTLDITPDRRELLLHVLDGRHLADAAASIRHEFERPLQRLFPDTGTRAEDRR
ncbi:MAG: Na+/H+ antiporter subunit E [Xanthomonadaceae bacterium]|nr:Na+/H+ antiporter subunit E [Xanthomonadaceae bacterium]